MDIRDCKKIMIAGSSGSGKSWLAKEIAGLTGYPLYHLDSEFWRPGWVMAPEDEKILRLQEIISGKTWIIDGNYSSTMEMRFAAADLIVLLDISRIICVISVAKRHGKKRSDLPDYLDESSILGKEFFELIRLIWAYPKKGRERMIKLHEKYPDKVFLRVRGRRKVRQLLKGWKAL